MWNPDFKYIPAAKTDISQRIREEWKRLGQLPPDEDPRVQENREKAKSYGQ